VKKTVLFSLLFIAASSLFAQTPYLKEIFQKDTIYLTADAANIKFPIHGKVKISPTGFVQYMQIEFWVYDATGREIYYANHAAPTSASTPEKYQEQMDRMVEKEYAAFMRRQGKMLFLRNGKNQVPIAIGIQD
jgi:hypothetical protein